MVQRIAVVGAGVSGLTCGVVCAERGQPTVILAEHVGAGTTSGAAAAIWYPYDAGPSAHAITWALETYDTLRDLTGDIQTGVSMLELRKFSRSTEIEIPKWAVPLGARRLRSAIPSVFASGFTLNVPLMDTATYLDYLIARFRAAGGEICANKFLATLEEVDPKFDLIVNCSGIGARSLVKDSDLEPHRGQIVIVKKPEDLSAAIVCDDSPLMYAIPRANDSVFGGTNCVSDDCTVDRSTTAQILSDCSHVLGVHEPDVLEERVGLRPFRRSGVRLERARLNDSRTVIHNYGHGGSGFTVSWGCAEAVAKVAGIEARV